jgi:NTE family protein
MKVLIFILTVYVGMFSFLINLSAGESINTTEIVDKIALIKQNIDTFKQILKAVNNDNKSLKNAQTVLPDNMPYPDYLKWGESSTSEKNNIVENPNTLVFSGGGARGPAYAGVLKYLQEANKLKNVQRFIGTSAGSIVCTFMSIGSYYESHRSSGDKHFWEIVYDIIEDENFIDFIDNPILKNFMETKRIDLNSNTFFTIIPSLIGSISDNYGLCSGNNILSFFKRSLEKFGINGNITFAELHKLTGKHLVLVSCSLSYRKTAMFDYKTAPDMPVVEAMRASMAIPFVFAPVYYNHDYFIDGGATNNYPINFFDYTPTDSNIKPITLGFMVFSKDDILRPPRKNIQDLGDYTSSVFELAMYNTGTALYKENVDRTVFIDCGKVGILSFDINKDEKTKLMNDGYDAIKKYYE